MGIDAYKRFHELMALLDLRHAMCLEITEVEEGSDGSAGNREQDVLSAAEKDAQPEIFAGTQRREQVVAALEALAAETIRRPHGQWRHGCRMQCSLPIESRDHRIGGAGRKWTSAPSSTDGEGAEGREGHDSRCGSRSAVGPATLCCSFPGI